VLNKEYPGRESKPVTNSEYTLMIISELHLITHDYGSYVLGCLEPQSASIATCDMVPTFMLCHLSLVLALDYNVSAFRLAMKTIFGVVNMTSLFFHCFSRSHNVNTYFHSNFR